MSRATTRPAVGSPAPDFCLPAVNDEMVRLSDCLLSGPVLVEFVRGTWCPDARRRLKDLAAARERFRRLRTRIIAIVCESPFTVRRYFAARPTPLTVLIDADRETARRYGVHQRFTLERWNLARPSTFLVDAAGYVRYLFVARIRTQSAEIEVLLEETRRLEEEARRAPHGAGGDSA